MEIICTRKIECGFGLKRDKRNENASLLRKMGVNLPKLELVISEWEARK